MDLGLKDRVAIVGGSSRGIGRAIALAFAQEGANVTICARTEADLRRTEIELARLGSQHHVLAIPADLSVARDIRRVVRDTMNRFGQIGILVTHLGHAKAGRPSEFDDDTITDAMEHNFMSSRELALLGYSKMLSNELAPFNITVNNVLAGPVKTDFLTATLETQAKEAGRPAEDLIKETTAAIPMRRLGKPEEVGDLVAFLASDRAGYITGTTLVIDGGRLQTLT